MVVMVTLLYSKLYSKW